MPVWGNAIRGVNVVVHLASRVMVLQKASRSPLAVYRDINVEGSRRVGRFGAEGGVHPLVYLSRITAQGKRKEDGTPFLCDHLPAPLILMEFSGQKLRSASSIISIRPS